MPLPFQKSSALLICISPILPKLVSYKSIVGLGRWSILEVLAQTAACSPLCEASEGEVSDCILYIAFSVWNVL